jgi:hypothetical protein
MGGDVDLATVDCGTKTTPHVSLDLGLTWIGKKGNGVMRGGVHRVKPTAESRTVMGCGPKRDQAPLTTIDDENAVTPHPCPIRTTP